MIETGNGKYLTENNNGILKVYRNKDYSYVWREPTGDGYILSLVHRIEELERQVLDMRNCENCAYKNYNKNMYNCKNNSNWKPKESK